MSAGQDDSRPAPASIVICSRDRRALLRDTVRSVLDADLVPAELVIVDQSESPDPELAAHGEVRGCRVRYLHSDTVGLSRARNIGLRAAAREVVVMIDDDMLVEGRWLAELLGGLPDDPRAVVTGRVLAAPAEDDAPGGVLPRAALVERDQPAVYRGLQHLDVVPGANVGLPRETVLALSGYDERLGAGTRFHSADDNDMGHRLLLAGCEVHHVPSAVVLHRAWRSPRELVRLRWQYGRGKGAFYAKHAGLRERTILKRALRDVVRRIRRALASLVRSPPRAAAELVSLAGIASGAVDWLLSERIPARLRRRRR